MTPFTDVMDIDDTLLVFATRLLGAILFLFFSSCHFNVINTSLQNIHLCFLLISDSNPDKIIVNCKSPLLEIHTFWVYCLSDRFARI